MDTSEKQIIDAVMMESLIDTDVYRYVRIDLPHRVQIRRIAMADLMIIPQPWQTIYTIQIKGTAN